MYNVCMKKTERFGMKVNEQFLKNLDTICLKKAGISTRSAAINYCVDVVMMEIEKEEEEKKKGK